MRNSLITTQPKTAEFYQGIPIHADPGTHDQAGALFRRYVPVGSTVLDVGAGAGAFSRRLVDAGYVITALDMEPEKWIPKGIPFRQMDINTGIPGCLHQKFDAACCLEVIEHVENPWRLLRDIHDVLERGGAIIALNAEC